MNERLMRVWLSASLLTTHPPTYCLSPNNPPTHPPKQTIVKSSKGLNYMSCLTAIDPTWLPPLALPTPLLSFHPPLSSPPPAYDAGRDCVVFYCVPKYGCRNWVRPLSLSPTHPPTHRTFLSSTHFTSSSHSPTHPNTKTNQQTGTPSVPANQQRPTSFLLLLLLFHGRQAPTRGEGRAAGQGNKVVCAPSPRRQSPPRVVFSLHPRHH